MLTKTVFGPVLILLAISILVSPVIGCSPETNSFSGITLSGPWDLYYLSVVINEYSKTDTQVPSVRMIPSANSVAEVNQGRFQGVLMGREPTEEELLGMKDFVIAYDAVCIIIDENSYLGGEYGYSASAPQRKTSGLQDLTSQDLRHIFSIEPGGAWLWNGEYYSWEPMFDRVTGTYMKKIKNWTRVAKPIGLWSVFPSGKFDTQQVLYQNLSLEEAPLLSRWRTFPVNSNLNLEEEVLSMEYSASIYYSDRYGPQDYAFKLGFASRRVMTVAPQHVPVKVVSVDGMNPLEKPEHVYDGTYPFSRKIHLLIPEKSPTPVIQLADFLESPEGQQAIAYAGYLPLALGGADSLGRGQTLQ